MQYGYSKISNILHFFSSTIVNMAGGRKGENYSCQFFGKSKIKTKEERLRKLIKLAGKTTKIISEKL